MLAEGTAFPRIDDSRGSRIVKCHRLSRRNNEKVAVGHQSLRRVIQKHTKGVNRIDLNEAKAMLVYIGFT